MNMTHRKVRPRREAAAFSGERGQAREIAVQLKTLLTARARHPGRRGCRLRPTNMAMLQQANALVAATLEAQQLAERLEVAWMDEANVWRKYPTLPSEFLSSMTTVAPPLNAIPGFAQLIESGRPANTTRSEHRTDTPGGLVSAEPGQQNS
jgi:hypothetical protein